MQKDKEIKELTIDYKDNHQEDEQQREQTLAMLGSLSQKLKHLPPMPSSKEQNTPNKLKKTLDKIK